MRKEQQKDFSDIFGDIFSDIFGGSSRTRSRSQRGADLSYSVEVSLEDAVKGTSINLDIPSVRDVRELGIVATTVTAQE